MKSKNLPFGNVEETAIMISINDLYIKKVERHINSYIPNEKLEDHQ